MTNTPSLNQEALKKAYFALLREKSAQKGEYFDQEIFQTIEKFGSKEEWEEEIAQVACAIQAYLASLPALPDYKEIAGEMAQTLERAKGNLVATLGMIPVRDVEETLAKCDSILKRYQALIATSGQEG